MIALLMATTLAGVDLDAAIRKDAFQVYDAVTTDKGRSRDSACLYARMANDGVTSLKKMKITRRVTVWDPKGAWTYTLTDEDLQRVDLQIVTAEGEAENLKLKCLAR